MKIRRWETRQSSLGGSGCNIGVGGGGGVICRDVG